MTTNNAVNTSLSGQTGTGNFTGATAPTLTSPVANTLKLTNTNGILDTNGNIILGLSPTASSVNYFVFANNATGNAPNIQTTGSDTNVSMNIGTRGSGAINFIGYGGSTNLFSMNSIASAVNFVSVQNNTTGSNPAIVAIGADSNITLQLNGKGTGGVYLVGTSTNDSAPNGGVGEFVSSVIASASAVTFTNGTQRDLTSISLTAGDWDVWGNISSVTLGTSPQQLFAWVSSTSATVPDASLYNGIALTSASGVLFPGTGALALQRRFTLTTTTTIYISGLITSTSGNSTACGGIYARRRR